MAFVAVLMAALGAIGVMAGSARGQCVSPTLRMTLDTTIQVFRLGDFDPSDTHFHPQVLAAVLCNDLDEPRQVMLSLVIDSDVYGTLATGQTMPFDLAPGDTRIDNRDLTEASGIYELEDYHITSEAEELEELVRDLGYLPEGLYCFRLTMEPAGTGPHDFSPILDEKCLTVTNPLNLEIIQPGAPFGDDLPVVVTAHPQFQWSSRATRWQITISEVEPGDGSGEDVMENVPVYETELTSADVFGGGGSGTLSWNYPSAGEDLVRGQSYCWQVTALVETSGGTEEIVSEVFCFRRWDPADLGSGPLLEVLTQILTQLEDQLGPELEGMVPTGRVFLDGEPVDPATLQEILDAITEGDLDIEQLRIE